MKKKKITKKAIQYSMGTTSVFALEAITLSHETKAFSECHSDYFLNGDDNQICLDIDDICVGDNENVGVDGRFYYLTGDGVSLGIPSDIHFTDGTLPSPVFPSISDINLNNYPSGAPPGTREEDFVINLQTPAVDYATGRITASIDTDGNARSYSGGWGSIVTTISNTFSVHIDHQNTSPVITAMAPNSGIVIDGQIGSFEASATFRDVESNNLNIVFELATDESFNNIIQTSGTYNADSNNSERITQTHTFSDLSHGQYYWRATGTETDAEGICADVLGGVYYQAGTNYQVSSDETFDDLPQITVTDSLPEAGMVDMPFLIHMFFGVVLVWIGAIAYLILQRLNVQFKTNERGIPIKIDLTTKNSGFKSKSPVKFDL